MNNLKAFYTLKYLGYCPTVNNFSLDEFFSGCYQLKKFCMKNNGFTVTFDWDFLKINFNHHCIHVRSAIDFTGFLFYQFAYNECNSSKIFRVNQSFSDLYKKCKDIETKDNEGLVLDNKRVLLAMRVREFENYLLHLYNKLDFTDFK